MIFPSTIYKADSRLLPARSVCKLCMRAARDCQAPLLLLSAAGASEVVAEGRARPHQLRRADDQARRHRQRLGDMGFWALAVRGSEGGVWEQLLQDARR